jgi:ER-bound oxygenase mpaB/B'/Rubber oxygenase, catalytic domain
VFACTGRGSGRPETTCAIGFWTRARIIEETVPLHRIIAGLLARVSVHAVPLDPLPRVLRHRVAEMQRRAAVESENLDELVTLLERENTELKDENDSQRDELSQLREEIATLQRDLDAQRQAWATVQEYGEAGMPPDPEEETAFSPSSWAEFVDYVDALESPAFVITERAREMCEQGPYPDPPRMWRHLERLAEAAEAWAAADCSVGNRLDEWIHENYGIEVALHDDSLGGAASFTYEDTKYSREPHVKVDDYVDSGSCGRIYFAYDTPAKRFIVDHIGLHL